MKNLAQELGAVVITDTRTTITNLGNGGYMGVLVRGTALIKKTNTNCEGNQLQQKCQPDPKPEPAVKIVEYLSNAPELSDFVYVPATGLYFQKERQLLGTNWIDAHKRLRKQGLKMPTMEEFRQLLRYLKNNPTQENTQIYDDITEIRDPFRAEWLDSRFEADGGKLYVFYHAFEGKNIIEKAEKISWGDFLGGKKSMEMEISLERWLKDATSCGLPKPGIQRGELDCLHYSVPVSRGVATFVAGSGRIILECAWNPELENSSRGVRGVKFLEKK
jgi:hypothetical protein